MAHHSDPGFYDAERIHALTDNELENLIVEAQRGRDDADTPQPERAAWDQVLARAVAVREERAGG